MSTELDLDALERGTERLHAITDAELVALIAEARRARELEAQLAESNEDRRLLRQRVAELKDESADDDDTDRRAFAVRALREAERRWIKGETSAFYSSWQQQLASEIERGEWPPKGTDDENPIR